MQIQYYAQSIWEVLVDIRDYQHANHKMQVVQIIHQMVLISNKFVKT